MMRQYRFAFHKLCVEISSCLSSRLLANAEFSNLCARFLNYLLAVFEALVMVIENLSL